MNGVMINVGGIIGNIMMSFLIQEGSVGLSFAIRIVLIIWLCGTSFWVISYLYYPLESIKKKNALEIKITQVIDIDS